LSVIDIGQGPTQRVHCRAADESFVEVRLSFKLRRASLVLIWVGFSLFHIGTARAGTGSSRNNLLIVNPKPSNPQHTQDLIREIWLEDAKARNENRTKNLKAVETDSWILSENIMKGTITRNYLESINRLELRYPQAVPYARQYSEEVLNEIYQTVEKFDATTRGRTGPVKKAAALRYLDRVMTNHEWDRIEFSGYPWEPNDFLIDPVSKLSNIEILSLVWLAVHDQAIFTQQSEIEDRLWGLIEAFANIQRAHNDSNGGIEFSVLIVNDAPSCAMGTFKRLIEHLEQSHPDIVFEKNIANEMIVRELLLQHQKLFGQITEEQKELIQQGLETQSEAYKNYLAALQSEVLKVAPNIPVQQLEENTNELLMEALFHQYSNTP
jgi:hypothetical protein